MLRENEKFLNLGNNFALDRWESLEHRNAHAISLQLFVGYLGLDLFIELLANVFVVCYFNDIKHGKAIPDN